MQGAELSYWEDSMSTMDALQLRKHELRVDLVRCAKAEGKTATVTMKVWHKIIECQNAERYLRRT